MNNTFFSGCSDVSGVFLFLDILPPVWLEFQLAVSVLCNLTFRNATYHYSELDDLLSGLVLDDHPSCLCIIVAKESIGLLDDPISCVLLQICGRLVLDLLMAQATIAGILQLTDAAREDIVIHVTNIGIRME